MKKMLFLAATAALALSSCSSEDGLQQETANEGNVAVAFDNYIERTTRSTDLLDNTTIQTTGFGVYGYDHGTTKIVDYTSSDITPNFFNNQKITYTASTWQYSNIKYWPNNPGAMLSFYAYAPYDGTISTDVTSNPRLILNGNNNGPALYYKVPTDLTKIVDLCWGAEFSATPELAPVNKQKPTISTKIKFNFKHAFARYGFNIEVFNDEMTDGNGHNDVTNKNIKQGTTIKINSIKLVGNFANEGSLRLYDGQWNAQISNTAEYELKDQFNPIIADGIVYDEAKNEIPLFADNKTYFMMIPGGKFRIQIDYDVITEDANMPDGKTTTNNVITSEKSYEAVAGVATDFHINLGMTTVKFDATVKDWNSSVNTEEVDLPNNTKN